LHRPADEVIVGYPPDRDGIEVLARHLEPRRVVVVLERSEQERFDTLAGVAGPGVVPGPPLLAFPGPACQQFAPALGRLGRWAHQVVAARSAAGPGELERDLSAAVGAAGDAALPDHIFALLHAGRDGQHGDDHYEDDAQDGLTAGVGMMFGREQDEVA